jgi:hypothetical protein
MNSTAEIALQDIIVSQLMRHSTLLLLKGKYQQMNVLKQSKDGLKSQLKEIQIRFQRLSNCLRAYDTMISYISIPAVLCSVGGVFPGMEGTVLDVAFGEL